MSQEDKPKIISVDKVTCLGARRMHPGAEPRDAIVTAFDNGALLPACDALRDGTQCRLPHIPSQPCVFHRFRVL